MKRWLQDIILRQQGERKEKKKMIDRKINFKIYAGIFLIITIMFFITIFFYDGIRMGTTDYGTIVNSIVLGLAGLLQFPFNTIVKPSSDSIYFLGIFINIAIYTFLIYYALKFVLIKMKKNNSDS
ncbi:MAG: hypothetical protein ABJN84_09730 [Flavobacteriaceae bacterium]